MDTTTQDPAHVARKKTLAAYNAVKHGLTCNSPILMWYEKEEDWQDLRQSLIETLLPVGAAEELLVEQIAGALWRKARVARYEAECANTRIDDIARAWLLAANPGDSAETLERKLRQELSTVLVPSEADYQRIVRYEAHLLRQFTRLSKALDDLQSRRLRAHSIAAPSAHPALQSTAGAQPVRPQSVTLAAPAAASTPALSPSQPGGPDPIESITASPAPTLKLTQPNNLADPIPAPNSVVSQFSPSASNLALETRMPTFSSHLLQHATRKFPQNPQP